MTRSTKEWIGKTPDSNIPPRVRQRVYDRHNGICHICEVAIKPGETFHAEHVQALIEGGENRESNLKPAHAVCNLKKGIEETKRKSKTNKVRQKHLGIKPDRKAIAGPQSEKSKDPKRNKRDPFAGLPKKRMYQNAR